MTLVPLRLDPRRIACARLVVRNVPFHLVRVGKGLSLSRGDARGWMGVGGVSLLLFGGGHVITLML
jgi:hypothetical protein